MCSDLNDMLSWCHGGWWLVSWFLECFEVKRKMLSICERKCEMMLQLVAEVSK